MDLDAVSSVKYELWGEITRGDVRVPVLLNPVTRKERITHVRTIMGWNRWARKDAKKKGMEFPKDAPRHFWQVNWLDVLWRGI